MGAGKNVALGTQRTDFIIPLWREGAVLTPVPRGAERPKPLRPVHGAGELAVVIACRFCGAQGFVCAEFAPADRWDEYGWRQDSSTREADGRGSRAPGDQGVLVRDASSTRFMIGEAGHTSNDISSHNIP